MPIYVEPLGKKKTNRNRRLPKKLGEREHARKRALERYNIELTRKLRLGAVKNIQTGKGICLEVQSNRVSVWKNVVPGYPDVPVVYDNKRHEITTVLKEGWLNQTPCEE